MTDDREKRIMMLTLEDATKVCIDLLREDYGHGIRPEDKKHIEHNLEQKCYTFEDKFAERFLKGVVADITADEICEQILFGSLAEWARCIRNNLTMGIAELVRERDGNTGQEKPL